MIASVHQVFSKQMTQKKQNCHLEAFAVGNHHHTRDSKIQVPCLTKGT